MKILYISHNTHLDYQDDCLFIGLKELFGADVVDINKKHHSYSNYTEDVKHFHGKGMSVTRVLEDLTVDRDDIQSKIKTNYFDWVIYGSITRCFDHLDLVVQCYPRGKVIFIDGEDIPFFSPAIQLGCPYFKRELTQTFPNVFPISFAIPTGKVNFNEVKVKDHSFITPKDPSTYVYDDECSYYKDYNEARFGFTMKKAGWDCLRHYEIMANGCIPFFEDLEHCPQFTMTSFPKKLCIDVRRDLEKLSAESAYQKYIQYLKEHFFENNTTTANSKRFIELIKTF